MINILIAEDDKNMRDFLTIALKNAGYNVTSTFNGAEALKALESGINFDLLITDIVMPEIDGAELARKANKTQPNIKIIFITGFAAMAAKQIDNNKTLSKPFHLNDLIKQIEEILE